MKEFDHAIAVLQTALDLAVEEQDDAAPVDLDAEARAKSYRLAIVALKREYRKLGSSLVPAEEK